MLLAKENAAHKNHDENSFVHYSLIRVDVSSFIQFQLAFQSIFWFKTQLNRVYFLGKFLLAFNLAYRYE